MNDNNLNLLNKNKILKNLLYNLNKNNKLSRDIPSYVNFYDDEADISIGKCYVSFDKVLENIGETFSNYETLKESDKIKSNNKFVIVKNINILEKNIYSSQEKIKNIFEQNTLQLKITEMFNFKYEKNLIYVFLYALYPSFINLENNKIFYCIKQFCQELSFNIDNNNIFEKYDYKKIISKSIIQSKLLNIEDNLELPYHIISTFLSDFFDINIILIINNLIIKTYHHNTNRLNLMLYYKNNKYYIIGTDTCNLINNNIFKLINESFTENNKNNCLNKFEKISKYKLDEIVQIALLLDIETIINNKKKKKSDLYNEIIDMLPNF